MGTIQQGASADDPGFSLRDKLIRSGIANEREIREQLANAYAIIQAVPQVDIRLFNPLEPKG